jgi:uncharacterized protein (TIGR02246 family)
MTAREPRDLHRLFQEGVNAGDVDALLTIYEEGATLIDPGGEPVSGTDALRAFLQQLVAMQFRVELETRVVHTAGDIALLSNTWRGTVTTDQGTVELYGTTAEVGRRQPDGTWKYVVDDPAFVA